MYIQETILKGKKVWHEFQLNAIHLTETVCIHTLVALQNYKQGIYNLHYILLWVKITSNIVVRASNGKSFIDQGQPYLLCRHTQGLKIAEIWGVTWSFEKANRIAPPAMIFFKNLEHFPTASNLSIVSL